MAEVWTALDFSLHTVNLSLSFTARLEKEDQLNTRQIIRFLLDHNQKMEKRWKLMQMLVANMTPEGSEAHGTQALEFLATPIQVITTPEPARHAATTPKGSGGSSDLIETPDLTSLMSWSDFPSLSTRTLQAWKSVILEGLSQGTPLAFRLPSFSPSSTHRKLTLLVSRRLTPELANPFGSFQDLIDSRIQGARRSSASPATAFELGS